MNEIKIFERLIAIIKETAEQAKTMEQNATEATEFLLNDSALSCELEDIFNKLINETTLKITVSGGVVDGIENMPAGWDYELNDMDTK